MVRGRDGDAATAARVPHRPGIDGLRALAVVAVVLYHADVSWLPGGFLGVDVFFVISGYLICSLLVAEWESTAETGRAGLDLAGFWIRRARRLLPALAAAVVGTALVASVVAPDAAQRLGEDAGGVLLYVSNWWQLARGESYVQAFGRPSPVQHLWSLAVEEQFYLVFPLVLAVVLPRLGRRPRVLAGMAALLGAASAVLMAVLWHPGADPTRVWFGTDTRATGLCLGVALAFLLDPGRLPRLFPDHRSIVLLDLAGAYGLLALGGLMVGIGELDPALFRGGFAACALASGAVVIAAAHPGTHVAWVLSRRPLQWAGTRSYAIYLWHWPVVVMTRPGLDVSWHGNAVLALRVGLTALLAELSWRLVEQPVRTGQLAAWWRARRPFARIRLVSGGALVASVLIAVVAAAPAEAPPATLAAALARPAVPVRLASDVAPAATTTTTTVLVTTTTVVPAPRAPSPTSVLSVSELVSAPTASPTTSTLAPAPPPAEPAPAAPGPPPVLAIGDSVLVASSRALRAASEGQVAIDAAVGRQTWEGLELLERYRDTGRLDGLTGFVWALGTNGPLSAREVERVAQLTAGIPVVVVVTVRVPKRWEAESNISVRRGPERFPRMRLADWHSVTDRPGVLSGDGVHPTPEGARLYARLILDQLHDGTASTAPTTSVPSPGT